MLKVGNYRPHKTTVVYKLKHDHLIQTWWQHDFECGRLFSFDIFAVDGCSPEPCENGGVCIAEGNSYSCDCLQPYHGKNCKAGMN